MVLVPTVERRPWGWLVLVLNIVPGGIGSIVAGVRAADRKTVWFGVAQFLLLIVFIGWLWSVVWGILLFRTSQ